MLPLFHGSCFGFAPPRSTDTVNSVPPHLNGVTFGSESPSAMNLVMMPDKGLKGMGAVCLDGSDAGFYFSPASDAAFNSSWQIYFEGGGWCYDELDCWERSFNNLGSSLEWPKTAQAGGIMSSDCTVNPSFCKFNRVFLAYCDGDSFAGNRDSPVEVKGTDGKLKPLYFRGRRILDAVLATLKSDFGLEGASDVLLTGCSAGGLATYLHTDYVHAQLSRLAPELRR